MSIWSRIRYSRPLDTLERAFGGYRREIIDTKALLRHIGYMSVFIGSISTIGGTVGVIGGALYLGQKEDQEVQAPDHFGLKGYSADMSQEKFTALYAFDCHELIGYPARVSINLEMLVQNVPHSTMDGLEGTLILPEAAITCSEAANPDARREEVHRMIGEVASQPELSGLLPKESLETRIDMNMAELDGVTFERVVFQAAP